MTTSTVLSLHEVEKAIRSFTPDNQRKLIIQLPRLLKIKTEDIKLLKLAEKTFNFWNNEEDSVYDTL